MPQERAPTYYYTGQSPPEKIKISVKPIQKSKKNNDTDLYNPLFNFSKTFSDNLLNIKPTDLAQSQPYIDLKILDLAGNVVQDLNVSFFQKQLNFNEIKGAGRQTDRPLISLENIQITTDQAAGYFYYTSVQLNLKIHKKNELTDRAILGLLFPGSPVHLTYGWNSPNKWLDKKQTLLLSVNNYDISFDETGQANLVVKCMAFNELLENTIIGDLNTLITSNPNSSSSELDGLFKTYKGLTKFLSYIDDLEKNDKNVNDFSLIGESAKSLRDSLANTKGEIDKNFQKYLMNVAKINKDEISFGRKTSKIETLSFHDIFYTMCNDTLRSMSALIPVEKFEVVYGSFNENCLGYSGKSISDFPIDYNKFKNCIRTSALNGEKTLRINGLVSILCQEFIENEEYIRQFSPSKKSDKPFQRPRIVVNFTNIGDTLTLSIVDIHSGIPPTTNQIKDLKKASLKDAQEKILNGTDIPIITLGQSNSFIKNVSFSRIDDASMEATLIQRAYRDSIYSPRSAIVNSNLQGAQAVDTPLNLPLQGSARVLGHIGWMPFRAFYMSSGIFLIDAIYVITKVIHTLSLEGFETQIDFKWN